MSSTRDDNSVYISRDTNGHSLIPAGSGSCQAHCHKSENSDFRQKSPADLQGLDKLVHGRVAVQVVLVSQLFIRAAIRESDAMMASVQMG